MSCGCPDTACMCACPACLPVFSAQSLGRPAQLKKAVLLEWFTVAWNSIEAIVGLVAGVLAGSVALVGFALDSVVEGSSGSILLWRLKAEQKGASTDAVERTAVRLVAAAFVALAAYVGARAAISLFTGARPEDSPAGIAVALLSLVVMPILAQRKRKMARQLDSRAMAADTTQTMICTYLSGVLLLGLLANAILGWWWADPLAAGVIAGFAFKEGRQLWVTEDFCCN